ncbi:MAG: glutamate racemase [Candidatus Omnitrophota bacterium]
MSNRNRAGSGPLGIFDSGIGGLTVVKEIVRELPAEEIVYFGDTARVPYGNKSPQTIVKFSLENARFLLKFGVKFIIVACNTSSSLALAALKKEFHVPILGVISPAVKKAAQISTKGRIGIIGTRATIASMCYQKEIARINPRIKSFTQACPLFVPLVEEGWVDNQITLQIVEKYLSPLIKKDIDTLILGCTHYPLLKRIIRKAVGKKIYFVDSAKELAGEVKALLACNGLSAENNGKKYIMPKNGLSLAKCRFYVSDEPAWFKRIGKKFLGKDIVKRCIG